MEKIIFTIRSRTEINRLSNILAKNGISNKIINTPFQLGMSCGLSLVSDVANYNQIWQIASQNGVYFNGIFKAVETPNGTKYIKMQ